LSRDERRLTKALDDAGISKSAELQLLKEPTQVQQVWKSALRMIAVRWLQGCEPGVEHHSP